MPYPKEEENHMITLLHLLAHKRFLTKNMAKCDKCREKKEITHRAFCDSCNKPHPLCEDCYQKGIAEGKLIQTKRDIDEDVDLDQLKKWT